MSTSLVDDIEDGERLAELDWPHVRRAVLAMGGIGPSRDWSRDAYPADLYREHGSAPDIVAAECSIPTVGGGSVTPWASVHDGNGTPSDSAMFAYLQRSYAAWTAAPASERYSLQETPRARAARLAGKERRAAMAAPKAPAPVAPARGTRSFAELVRDLRAKRGADVDLSGLRSEYVSAYETGERITIERDGRTYRGTVGATRGNRPRFVLLLSLDL